MKVNIFKVKKPQQLKAWGKEVESSSIEEAIESIKEENVAEESMHVFTLGGEVYMVGVMVAEKGKAIIPPNNDREINKRHFKVFREAIGEEVEIEKIYSIRV